MSPLSLIFMGTPEFAIPALQALCEAGHHIKAVYTQPPRPTGRGHVIRLSPVHQRAEEKGLKVLTPTSLKSPEVQEAFSTFQADFAVVVAYGLILPKMILKAPKGGCVNIHGSLLPRWRGAAPVQRAIEAGDLQTGITIMQMDEGLDTGPMLLERAVPLTSETTAATLYSQLSHLGAKLIVEALEGMVTGRLLPRPQPEEGVTHAPKLQKEEGRLDWHKPALQLERQIRAFTPWPGSYFMWKGERIKVLKAKVHALSPSLAPGTIFEDPLWIACHEGALQLLELQRPGKSPLPAQEFLNGMPLLKGTRLSFSDEPL